MRGICVLLFLTYAGSYPSAFARSCDVACSSDEAKAIYEDLKQQMGKQAERSCVVEFEDQKKMIDRSLEWGARIVKYRYARSCDPKAPASLDTQKQEELGDFLKLAFDAVGINHQRKNFESVCFSEHSVLEMKAGDLLQMGKQTVIVDGVGKDLAGFNRSMACEDLVSDSTRINVDVIFVSMENGARNVVRGALSGTMGDESANPWVTRFVDAAQKACLIKQHKRTPASVSQSADHDFVVKRFHPEKPGCLTENFMPFRYEGGTCAKCCLLQNAEVGP